MEKTKRGQCNICGELKNLHAKGICRVCYDNRRLGLRIKINDKLTNEVIDISKELGFTYNKTILHLIYLGVKHRNHIKELGGKI